MTHATYDGLIKSRESQKQPDYWISFQYIRQRKSVELYNILLKTYYDLHYLYQFQNIIKYCAPKIYFRQKINWGSGKVKSTYTLSHVNFNEIKSSGMLMKYSIDKS